MSDPILLAAVLLTALIAGMIQGTIGFGFVLVAAPLMSIFVDPHLVVPAMIVPDPRLPNPPSSRCWVSAPSL